MKRQLPNRNAIKSVMIISLSIIKQNGLKIIITLCGKEI